LQAGTRSGSSRHAAGTAGGDKARLA